MFYFVDEYFVFLVVCSDIKSFGQHVFVFFRLSDVFIEAFVMPFAFKDYYYLIHLKMHLVRVVRNF